MQLLFNTVMLEVNRWTEHHKITIPLIELLPELIEANFNELEIWQYHISSLSVDELKKLKDKMDELRIIAPVVGLYASLHLLGKEAEEMDALFNRMIDASLLLGSKLVKIKPGSLPSASMDSQIYSLSVKRIKELASKLEDNGMMLSMETHTFSMCDTEESTLRLMNDLSDLKNVGICYQPFDEQNTEQAMATYSKMYPYIIHIHLQNLPDGNAETTTYLETGKWMDYKKLLPHIRKSGFDNFFSLEFTEGIFPPEGEKFNPQVVIDNAKIDRKFFLKWFK